MGTDGGVFALGDAGFYGSLPGINVTPNSARVADSVAFHAYAASQDVFFAPTPDAHRYWIVDSAGDVFSFGDAGFYGSLAGVLSSSARLLANDVVTGHQVTIPVTGLAATGMAMAIGWPRPSAASTPSATPPNTARFPPSALLRRR